jgi:hypothetical protein
MGAIFFMIVQQAIALFARHKKYICDNSAVCSGTINSSLFLTEDKKSGGQ